MIDARKYLQIPFKDKGRDFDGVDCWGLVYLIYKEELGIELPLYLDGYSKANTEEVEKIISENKGTWKQITKEEASAFDAVLMRSILRTEARSIVAETHVGIMISPTSFIHIEDSIGVNVCHLNRDQRVVNRIVGFFKYEN